MVKTQNMTQRVFGKKGFSPKKSQRFETFKFIIFLGSILLQSGLSFAAPNQTDLGETSLLGPFPFSLLTIDHIGETITIVGRITNKYKPKEAFSPHRWYLTDNQGVLLATIDQDLFQKTNTLAGSFSLGNMARIQGRLRESKGILQIIPEHHSDITIPLPGSPMGIWRRRSAAQTHFPMTTSSPTSLPTQSSLPTKGPVVATQIQKDQGSNTNLLPFSPPFQQFSERGSKTEQVLETEQDSEDRQNSEDQQDPEDTILEEPDPSSEQIFLPDQITEDLLKQEILAHGRVSKFRPSWKPTAPSILTLEGEGDSIDAVYWSKVEKALQNRAQITQKGTELWVRGQVSEHRGRLQIKVSSAEDIYLTNPAAAPPSAIDPEVSMLLSKALAPSEIGPRLFGETAALTGYVTQFRPTWKEDTPSILTLSEGTSSIEVVFWSAVREKLGEEYDKLTQKGARLIVIGKVQEYHGRTQIRVKAPEDMILAQKAQISDAQKEGPSLSPSQVSQDHIGQRVTVRGVVESVRHSSRKSVPTRTLLGDERGRVSVVYWEEDAKRFMGRNAPQEGRPWAVFGTVHDYKGEIQIRAIGPAHP